MLNKTNLLNSFLIRLTPNFLLYKRYPLATKSPFSCREINDKGIVVRPSTLAEGPIYSRLQRAFTNSGKPSTWKLEVTRKCMLPNLKENDKIIFEEVQYLGKRFDPSYPPRFAIVCFWHPIQDIGYIKRVIGLPKETISFKDGEIYINGEKLVQSFPSLGTLPDMKPIEIPKKHIFVLADNRDCTGDSRDFGPLHISNVFGIVKEINYCNVINLSNYTVTLNK